MLLGLFGVQLVSSRFSTAGVSPLSRPEVLRALQAARSLPPAANEVALPATPDTTAPQPSTVDAGPARPSAGPTSSSAPAPPASTLPRPGATAETFVEAATPSSTTSTAPPPESSTTTSTVAPTGDTKGKPKSDSKTSGKSGSSTSTSSSPTTTTTSNKGATTTSAPPPSRSGPSSQPTSDTRTLSSVGGVVAVRYSGGKVELKWARPNPGYQVYVRSNGPDQVIVYFYTKNHVSQVVAYYNGTTPDYDVQEYSGSGQGRGR